MEYVIAVRLERATQEAAQQQLAEQHHRQVLIRGLWEGLGQALNLRRAAHQNAHRHFQLCRQRLVSNMAKTPRLTLCVGVFIEESERVASF